MLYLRLFHGRTDPAQDMDDWGTDGPVFGPYLFAHTTYNCCLKLGKSDDGCDELYIAEPDMVFYDGVYYGDWSVFSEAELKEDSFELSLYDPEKAKPPKIEKRQAKIIVYIKGGVCQDVKTNIPEGLWDYMIVDYDNDPDLPSDYVPFSDNEMEPLFL
jgi:hypothetical protein